MPAWAVCSASSCAGLRANPIWNPLRESGGDRDYGGSANSCARCVQICGTVPATIPAGFRCPGRLRCRRNTHATPANRFRAFRALRHDSSADAIDCAVLFAAADTAWGTAIGATISATATATRATLCMIVKIIAGRAVVLFPDGITPTSFDDGQLYDVRTHLADSMIVRGWAREANPSELESSQDHPEEPKPKRRQ